MSFNPASVIMEMGLGNIKTIATDANKIYIVPKEGDPRVLEMQNAKTARCVYKRVCAGFEGTRSEVLLYDGKYEDETPCNNIVPGTRADFETFWDLVNPVNMRQLELEGKELIVFTRSGRRISVRCETEQDADELFDMVSQCLNNVGVKHTLWG